MDEVDHLLNTDPSRVLGLVETEHLEAKGETYALDEAGDRYELAKDVSSFANGSGGHLLIGVETERDPDRVLDTLKHFNPMGEGEFDISKYSGVIREYVYPEIRGLTIQTVQIPDGEIGVIRIPPQPRHVRPFLIMKVAEGEGHLKQIIVGFAERKGDASDPVSPKRLQSALKKGFSSVAGTLESLERKVDILLEHTATPDEPHPEETLPERIDRMMEE